MNYKILLRKEYLFLYLIILIGAFLRLQGVFTNSFAFTYDVGRDMLALWNIVHLHKIPLIGATTGLPGIFYGPWWYYMLTPFFIIFSGNPQGIALTMSLVGIATIIFGFFLGRKIGNSILGFLVASVISVSPVMVSLSSQIWNPNIAPFFVICALLILNKIYNNDHKDKSKYYLYLGLLLALIVDLEVVFGLLLSVGIILSVIIIVNKKISIKNIFYFVVGELIIFSPRIFFEFRHQFLMTKSFLGFFTKTGNHQTEIITYTFVNRLGVMFDQFNSTLATNNRLIGLIILIFIAVSLFIFYKKSENNIRKFITTSLIVIMVFLLGTVFFSHDIWPHYLVGVPVFYILLFSISLYAFGKLLSNNILIAAIAGLIFIINLNPPAIFQSLTSPLWEGDASVYRNQIAVVDYIYSQAHGKDFKYVVYTPPVYDYTYQYLFLWYGPDKYHYSPSKQSHLAYFILEPDFQYPSRLTDWLKSRAGDGKIVKSEVVKGGITVQTRTN